MRNLEFRIWSPILKRFFKPQWIAGDGLQALWLHTGNKISIENNPVIQQFTGLFDKNKKKIFEGDIVKWNNKIWVISWNKKNCQYFLQSIKSYNAGKPIAGEWHFGKERMENYSKIIGNIFQHPKLLK
jgi:uncharacterized phage protein (TIGR01671 family)